MRVNEVPMTEQAPNEDDQFQSVPHADVISLETVVNILVKKGVCTVEEIFTEEGKLQEKRSQEQKAPVVNIKSHHNKHHWLKKLMSKYRWSRRLGTRLFGWKWKKVKRNQRIIKLRS